MAEKKSIDSILGKADRERSAKMARLVRKGLDVLKGKLS